MRVSLERMRGQVGQQARPVKTGRRRLLLAVLKGLQTPGRYQGLSRQGTGRSSISAGRAVGRNPYHATTRVYQSRSGWEKPERRQQIGGRRAVQRVGLGLGRASGVVVVLLRQFLLHLVAPRPPAVVQRGGRATVVVPLLPRPFPLLVLGVRVLGRGTLGVLGPALAQQSAYAERVAPGRLVLQRPRVGLARGRGIGALGVVQAAAVVGVVAGAAARRVGVVHVYLFRRVHVAVAVNRHHLPRSNPGPVESCGGLGPLRSFVHRKFLRMLILRSSA